MTKTRTRSRLAALGIGIVALVLSIAPGIASARQHTMLASPLAAPVFSFPTNGTSYPANGPYLFQVQPVSGATGYLWSFVQNGMIVYQNLAWDGHLSPASYTISTSSKAHSLIHAGDLHVWVRALLKNGQWSATGAVMVRIQGAGHPPKATPTPRPHPTNTPQPLTGHPTAGTVLFQADTSGALDKFAGTPDWGHLNGMVTNDGSSSGGSWLPVPYTVQGTNDYALEAEIQVVKPSTDGGEFGLSVRHTDKGDYNGHILYPSCCDSPVSTGIDAVSFTTGVWDHLGQQNYDPATDWHTYRLEAKGNQLRFLIDGSPVAAVNDNRYLRAGIAGLWCNKVQIVVRRVIVVAL